MEVLGVLRPVLLDLFCGGGGAAWGYHLAGFDVVGVDIVPQERYPFRFVQADAMTFPLNGVEAVHASPPCQRYSVTSRCYQHGELPDLYEAMRDRVEAWGGPWVLENVVGAPVDRGRSVLLCGSMFGLGVRRHRWFESNVPFMVPSHPRHSGGEDLVTVAGHHRDVERWREAMGIGWMKWYELTQAVPPAYTEFLGVQLLRYVLGRSEFEFAKGGVGFGAVG